MEMDSAEISPASSFSGDIAMPGDKAISHRFAMLGSLASGTTTIRHFAASADSHSTLNCLERLGVSVVRSNGSVAIQGLGGACFVQPELPLDAENSGTTVRMMSGILAGFPMESTFVGDASLSQRPMKRIIEPLRKFGAAIDARDGNFLPLTIRGGDLQAIEYRLPVASAQVKSAVLLAGLRARGTTRVIEPSPTRNHTELALKRFGVQIQCADGRIEIEGGQRLTGLELSVPGDLSSAAFFVAAALGAGRAHFRIRDVGLNPTRSGFLNLLQNMGARIRVEVKTAEGGEPVGDILAESSKLSGGEIAGPWIGNVIDEIPVLAVLGTRMEQGIRIREAAELRAKETDRIQALVTNLRRLGVDCDEFPDGLFVPGNQKIHGGSVDSFGDHRIAMASAVAGVFAESPVLIREAGCVRVSFPGFFETLNACRS